MMAYVHIDVNGREIIADKDKTLLQTLLENGYYIPNLCFYEELEGYGGCGLCLVSIEGYPKPVRSCAIKPSADMRVITDTPEIIASRSASLSLMLADHRGDCIAPCKRACPTNQDAQGYIALIADGKYEEAIRLIKEDNPFPASIGRVCPHPCEDACRRKYAEEAISICSLKRFAADTAAKTGGYIPERKNATGKRVAVVGAGPAGLSCAAFLACAGHGVEVFESMSHGGGMLRYGIPAYRLSDETLDCEIKEIENLGVKINYNKRLGRDITINSLKDAYDAIFIAVGAWQSAALGCENDKLPGVLGGIDFLREVAEGNAPDIGKRVAVIGGGNTAMDAVRTARRLGAEVTLIYRRTRAEMPASEWEIEEAEDEGVKFSFLVSPDAVIEKSGRAAGQRLQKMELGAPDASGRRRPMPVEGAVEELEFDTIISAIGQKVLDEGIEELEKHRWGTIIADSSSFQTNIEGVFAGGDAINDGPDIAIQAIAHAKHAARAIDAYLNNSISGMEKPFYVEKTPEISKDIGKTEYAPRVKDSLLPPKERIAHFKEISRTFTEEEAKQEASRCLECGCSALYDCKLLPLLQSHERINVSLTKPENYKHDQSHPFIWRDNNKCILCGLCVRVCAEIVGKEIYCFNERGIATTVECAFNAPLAQSECISCGYCSAVCPTGALEDRRAFVKSPPLPPAVNTIECGYCEQKCLFDVYSYGKNISKAIPADMSRSCSVGRYGLTLKNNGGLNSLSKRQSALLKQSLFGDLRFFKGDTDEAEKALL